jgi:hypothetical protein
MSQTELPTMEQRLVRWALSGDTGASSQTLACAVLGIRQEDRAFGFAVPCDYSDFGRCYRLVQLVPEILTMWDKVVAACPAWGPLAEHWDELVALYEADTECQVSDTCRHMLRTLRDQYQRSKREGV